MEQEKRFFEAARSGDVEQLEEMLRNSPELGSAQDENGVSVLLQAAYHRQEKAVEILLAAPAALDIFEAAVFGRLERLRELAAHEASPCSGDGFTPLHLAAFFSRPDAVRTLLEAGAEVGAEARNPSRVTPLHSAAAAGDTEITALLLEHGAPPNAAQHGGWTALHSAAKHGHRTMVEKLLAHGADPVQTAEDGRSAADLATAEGHGELAALLR